MRTLLKKYMNIDTLKKKLSEEEQLARKIDAIYEVLSNLYGHDKLVLKAGKVDALNLLKSEDVMDRTIALQRIIFHDPTIEKEMDLDIDSMIEEIEDELADMVARKNLEDNLEQKVADRMQQRHEEYIKEIKMQVLKETTGPENPFTLKKYAELEKLETINLARKTLDLLRPASLDEIVGQTRGVTGLLSKLASPFPQHVIIYGPPGVGKTTAARLVLEYAKNTGYSPFKGSAKFIEVDGTTLRWDPREITNPLLGSVHDPIYQGAKRDLADVGIPEPKPGLVTDAHGGVLFIDEIGEMDPLLQNKLLKVLEEKRIKFDSAYYDPSNTGIPKYIKKLFEEGAPADFILVGATTKSPGSINPALRSRCAEVFFEPLTKEEIEEIVKQGADKLNITLDQDVIELIGQYAIEGRKAINLLVDAYSLSLFIGKGKADSIEKSTLEEVIRGGRYIPNLFEKGTSNYEIGRTYGLGVNGFLGSLIEIEAIAFSASHPGKGQLRFNETAGSMAKDSVFNALTVVKNLTGKDISNYDIHVNMVGGGNVDGPSAGTAILTAIISAIEGWQVPQDIAMTGEVSIRGKVKGVGGVFEKIFGARQGGIKKVLIPKDNLIDIPYELKNIEVITVETIEEVLSHIFKNKGNTQVS
jgi:ATP-dependent Lon protease